MPILIPAESTEDWRKLLRDPGKHWRHGYSAKSLADRWHNEDGFPADVRQLFESADVPGVHDAKICWASPNTPRTCLGADTRPARTYSCWQSAATGSSR